eukprot:TRINITY_DN34309_c0_g1_i2.p1 TRINITY_DN34309_c0_g1~~TRINITY_DN34309_c0_g1_i2.p1  ORF type:complete len:524 (-),score=60.93 TRINITY_DN34309_c0_g1_i2:537-2003(-)
MSCGVLEPLEEGVLFELLSCCSHDGLCRVQATCRAMKAPGRDQYLWRQLYEATRGGRATLVAPTDWIAAFRRLDPAWDVPVLDPLGKHRWRVLSPESEVPDTLGGQDPKLYDLGQGRLLVLPGTTMAEPRGGFTLRQHKTAYLFDLNAAMAATPGTSSSSSSSSSTSPWRPVHVEGEPPPSLHGSVGSAFGDGVIADRLVTYGGGNHVGCHDHVNCLDLSELPDVVTWSKLAPCGLTPGPRYAGAAAVYEGNLITLGGRTYGHFHGGDELWVLQEPQSDRPAWSLIRPGGEGPSERVWLSAVASSRSLVVYGGGEWTFDEDCWGNDSYGTVWVCDMVNPMWVRYNPYQPQRILPAPRCGAVVALCGSQLLVYGGCDLARQSYMEDVWLLDLQQASKGNAAGSWTRLKPDKQKLAGRRSHGVAVGLPSARAAVVFGGAQYFNGRYYRDLLILEHEPLPALPVAEAVKTAEVVAADGSRETGVPTFEGAT